MIPDSVETFLQRAGDFSRGMNLLREDDAYSQSAALLVVHAAIAYADALRIGLGGGTSSFEDHREAADALQRLVLPEEAGGVSRFRKLLGAKNMIAYGARRVHVTQLRSICLESQRFALWVNSIGTVRVAEWR